MALGTSFEEANKTKDLKVRTQQNALAHPLFKRAAQLAESSVYESSPEVSKAEYKAGAAAASAAAGVYESAPTAAPADAGYAARAEEAAQPTIFESRPSRRSADCSAETASVGACTGAWESQPQASKADALHQRSAYATEAEELILTAAEHYSSAGDVVYENAPAQSSAHVTHACAVQASTATVYESTPSRSSADATSAMVAHTESARRLIEEAAGLAEENQRKEAPSEVPRVQEARDLVQKALDQSAPVAYESVPAESLAHARHDAESVCSEETDEEDEVQ